MDHVVYVNAKAKELESLLSGEKTMIIRGAAGRKLPHGRVNVGDILYFINNNAEGLIKARAEVGSVFNSEKMSKEESTELVEEHQDKTRLTDKQFKRWASKRYIVLIEVDKIEALSPFTIDKGDYGNMDDWLPVEDIEAVRLPGGSK
jgi:hypothetical protein